jgi:hypothetical protein
MGRRIWAGAVDTVIKYYAILLWSVTALTIVYLILLPAGGDVIIGITWADLEALQGHFPSSLSDLWLSRGIGYKLFLYLAEGLSRLVAGDALRVRLYVFNAIYIGLGLGLLTGAYFALLSRCDPTTVASVSRRDRAETLALAALLFLPAGIWSWAQDTHISVLLCVLGIALALSRSERAQWCSGVILILLFSIKGVTALDFLFVQITVFATGDHERIRRVIISASIATIVTALAYATILRSEFENIVTAAQLQRSPEGLRGFVTQGVEFARYNPAIPVALLALAAAAATGLWKQHPRLVGFAIAIWLAPLAAIFTQREFFVYHYQGVVLSAWLCLVALYLAHGGRWSDLLNIRSGPPLVKLLVLLACCTDLAIIGHSLRTQGSSFTATERRLNCQITFAREARSLLLTADPKFTDDDDVLYLHWETYGIGLRSASRFFFPLPLQKQNVATALGADYLRSILTYKGAAVVAYPPGLDRHPSAIDRFLEANYRPVGTSPACMNAQVWIRTTR